MSVQKTPPSKRAKPSDGDFRVLKHAATKWQQLQAPGPCDNGRCQIFQLPEQLQQHLHNLAAAAATATAGRTGSVGRESRSDFGI